MTNTPLLEDYIDRSGYKRSYIAKRLGVSSYTLAMKINNESEFKASEIDSMCEILSIDMDQRMAIFFAKKVDFKSTTNKDN